jgi:structural maintenance of chromosome 2
MCVRLFAFATSSQPPAQLVAQRQAKRDQLEADAKTYADIKTAYDDANASLQQSEALLQTLVTGLSSTSNNDASSSGYMGQLAAARAKGAALGTEAEQARVRIGHLTKDLKEKEPRAAKAAGDGKGLLGELEKAKKERTRLEADLGGDGGDDSAHESLAATREELSKTVRELSRKRDDLRSGLARLDFQYADPERGFDRRKVKGLVANLVEIDEANFSASTALEISAGGRLYNVRARICTSTCP